jgi:hypothetical protein
MIGQRTWSRGNASKARYPMRAHETELIACGALTRIGRRKAILGAGYAVFLAKGLRRVPGFEIAPNRTKSRKYVGPLRAGLFPFP